MASAFRSWRCSHSICSGAADGSLIGNLALLGLRTTTSMSWRWATISFCQSGQPVIPPAKKTAGSGPGSYSVKASMYCIVFIQFMSERWVGMADFPIQPEVADHTGCQPQQERQNNIRLAKRSPLEHLTCQ